MKAPTPRLSGRLLLTKNTTTIYGTRYYAKCVSMDIRASEMGLIHAFVDCPFGNQCVGIEASKHRRMAVDVDSVVAAVHCHGFVAKASCVMVIAHFSRLGLAFDRYGDRLTFIGRFSECLATGIGAAVELDWKDRSTVGLCALCDVVTGSDLAFHRCLQIGSFRYQN